MQLIEITRKKMMRKKKKKKKPNVIEEKRERETDRHNFHNWLCVIICLLKPAGLMYISTTTLSISHWDFLARYRLSLVTVFVCKMCADRNYGFIFLLVVVFPAILFHFFLTLSFRCFLFLLFVCVFWLAPVGIVSLPHT